MQTQLSLFSVPGTFNINPLVFDFGLDDVFEPPKPVKPVNPNVLTFLPGTKTQAEVIAAWETLPHEIRYGKLQFTFSRPTSLYINSRKLGERKTIHQRRVFIGKSTGSLCYTNIRRSGFPFGDGELSCLIKIEPETESKLDMVEKVRKLANRIFPGTWDDLKVKLETNPQEYFANYGYSVTSIADKFPDYVITDIKDAFENKSKYTYDTGGNFRQKKTGRDLKVECKLCDDGIYRAWFSSEFPGCANGDYWLLINPTTAICKERD